MESEKEKRWVRVEKYDPLIGDFVREIANTDIVTTTGRSAAGGSAIISSTNGANTILYPYIITIQSVTGYAIVALMAGTTTLGIYGTGTTEETAQFISSPEAPLGKVPASASLSVDVIATETTGATLAVTVVSKRVPINSKI